MSTQITWTRTEAGRYEHAESGVYIRQGDSGNWFVHLGTAGVATSAPTLTRAKVAAKPLVLAALQAKAERAPVGITVTRDERTVELSITTTEEVTSFRGTAFVPNHARVRLSFGEVVSVSLERVTDQGWGIDDPAGPDGAELDVDFAGGELAADRRAQLPKVAQDILAHIETGKA